MEEQSDTPSAAESTDMPLTMFDAAQLTPAEKQPPAPVEMNPAAPVLLAIDTCTQRSSVALRDAVTLRAECTWESDRHHTAAVSAQISRMMRSCNIAPAQIGAVTVAIGPGSFTGVRCGLAIAKGYAIARNISLIGVSAFEVIAAAQPVGSLPILALVEVGRLRVAVCRYERVEGVLRAEAAWKIMSHKELAESIESRAWVCGDVSPALMALLQPHATIAPAPLNLRRAGYLAEIAYPRWQSGKIDDPLTLMPMYSAEV